MTHKQQAPKSREPLAWTIAAIATLCALASLVFAFQARATPRCEAQPLAIDLYDAGIESMYAPEAGRDKYARALRAFQAGHDLDARHLQSQFGVAWARQMAGAPETDWWRLYEDTAREATQLAYFCYLNMSEHYRQSQDYKAETDRLLDATRIDPGSADGWLRLGIAQFRSGDAPGAEVAWTRAVSLSPDLATTIEAIKKESTSPRPEAIKEESTSPRPDAAP